MKATKYNVSFLKINTQFIATYSNGQFKRLEHNKGGLSVKVWELISEIIPIEEKDIDKIVALRDGKLIFDKEVEKDPESQYKQFLGVYFRFYERTQNLKPKFNGTEGAALKEIIKYLNDNYPTEAEALHVWKQLLSNWDNLEDFYRMQVLLRQINSNIGIIINLSKTEKKGAFPNEWSEKYEKTLDNSEKQAFWAHLRTLGLKAVKNKTGKTIKWAK